MKNIVDTLFYLELCDSDHITHMIELDNIQSLQKTVLLHLLSMYQNCIKEMIPMCTNYIAPDKVLLSAKNYRHFSYFSKKMCYGTH